ncbi:MAG: hypothetical protein K0U72_13580 [Gammaproteobacteria bacterium]|nr:hypothetical protein [Gammaproteobacteria bacterium]
MKRFILALTAATFFSAIANADGLEAEFGYTRVNLDDNGIDVDPGALYAFVGYGRGYSAGTKGVMELFLASGISDDNVGPVKIDLEPSYGIAYRYSRELQNDFSIYGRAIYANLEAKASGIGAPGRTDERGFGLSVGGAYKRFSLSYTQFLGDLDAASMISIGYQFGS